MRPSLLLLAGLLLPSAALATSAAEPLGRAKAAYEAGDYKSCRDGLLKLLKTQKPSLTELRETRLYLAASYYFLNDRDSARKQLEELFRKDHFARIDPVVFPPEIVELGDEVLKQLEQEEASAPSEPTQPRTEPRVEPKPRSEPAPTPPVQDRTLSARGVESPDTTNPGGRQVVVVSKAPPPVGFAFIPFGVGQFSNEQYGKGAVFLGLESLALISFVANAAMAESLKTSGTPFLSYEVPDDKLDQFHTHETWYIISFWTGVGIYALGVADALINRPAEAPLAPAATTELRFRLLPNGMQVRW